MRNAFTCVSIVGKSGSDFSCFVIIYLFIYFICDKLIDFSLLTFTYFLNVSLCCNLTTVTALDLLLKKNNEEMLRHFLYMAIRTRPLELLKR